MKFGVFAFGHAGCSIADQLCEFDSRTRESMIAYTIGFDTDKRHLESHDNISTTILFGQQEFNGKGSQSDIEPVVSEANKKRDTFLNAAKQERKQDIDGFLLIGSLGGGTSAGGISVCADVLTNEYPTLPTYAVGVLPSQKEPDLFTLTASRGLQSWVSRTDSVILYDNDHLGVGIPGLTDGIDEDTTSYEELFTPVNQAIARTLHFTFTSDERYEDSNESITGELVPTSDDIIDVLSTGGLATISYTSSELPRKAWPGMKGNIYEFFAALTDLAQPNKNQQPNTETSNEPDPDTVESTSKNNGWPHPTDLLPALFQENATMCGVNTQLCQNSFTLLIGQQELFNVTDCERTTQWMENAVDAESVTAGLYPIKSKKIAAIHLSSGIGIQPRIDNLHNDAELIADRILSKQQKTRKPKQQNIFTDYETSVPPAF